MDKNFQEDITAYFHSTNFPNTAMEMTDNNEKEPVESHGHLHPEWILHLKKTYAKTLVCPKNILIFKNT